MEWDYAPSRFARIRENREPSLTSAVSIAGLGILATKVNQPCQRLQNPNFPFPTQPNFLSTKTVVSRDRARTFLIRLCPNSLTRIPHTISTPTMGTITLQSTTAPTQKPRTTFLDLPRELRQQILSQSYPFTLLVKPPVDTHISQFRTMTDNRNKRKCDQIKASLTRWHDDLSSVDPIVENDLCWVYQKWVEGVDQVYRDCEGGRRGLFIMYWTF